jgi:hypothetical protein
MSKQDKEDSIVTPVQKAQAAMEAAARARLAVVNAARRDRAEAAARAVSILATNHWLNEEELTELIEWVIAESGRGPLTSGVRTHQVCALLAEVLHKRRTQDSAKETP